MFVVVWFVLATQSRVTAARGRQNCLTISKYSHAIWYMFPKVFFVSLKSFLTSIWLLNRCRPPNHMWERGHRGSTLIFFRYRPHSFANNPQLCGIFIFKNQSGTFFKVEADRGQMNHLRMEAFDLKNVPLWFLNMRIPHNCWILKKEGGRYLKKWEKEPLWPLYHMRFGSLRQPPYVLGRPTSVK